MASANTLVAQDRAVLFATAPELLAMIGGGFNTGQAEDLMEACQRGSFDSAQERRWLMVDDLGAERLTTGPPRLRREGFD